MMITILDKNLRVLVVFVKFDRTIENFEIVAPFLIEKIDEVNHILPTLLTHLTEKYAYRNAAELKVAFRKATDDVLSGNLHCSVYNTYLYKIFRGIGIIESTNELTQLLCEFKELAEYIKVNKNEIY